MIIDSTWIGGAEPAPYYALAEVVYQALHGNCHVPVRALAAIAGQCRTFSETAEMEVRGDRDFAIELDLLAIADGRLLVGEAKISPKLASRARQETVWLKKLDHVCQSIGVDELVFATSAAEWAEPTRSRIYEQFAHSKVRLIEGC